MEIFCNVEIDIRVKKRLASFAALPIAPVSADVPFRIAAICIRTDIVGNVCDHKLRFRYAVTFEVLEVVVVQLASYFSVFRMPTS